MHHPAPSPARDTDPREVAVAVVAAMLGQGRSLTACLDEHAVRLDAGRDKAFAGELCYGVARWLVRLQACLDMLVEKPLREKDLLVRVVLLLGLYQLMYTRVAEHAAVAESVSLVRRVGKHTRIGW